MAAFYSVQAVRQEYDRLDEMLGIDTKYLQIIRFNGFLDNRAVAFCRFSDGPAPIPIQIVFSLGYLEQLPVIDHLDVVRHEYAHAAAMILYGPQTLNGTGHGPMWQKVCRQIGCRPSPYTYNVNVSEKLDEMDDVGGVCIECCRCGAQKHLPEDHRLVNALRMGFGSWNFNCPECGGFRFRLIKKN